MRQALSSSLQILLYPFPPHTVHSRSIERLQRMVSQRTRGVDHRQEGAGCSENAEKGGACSSPFRKREWMGNARRGTPHLTQPTRPHTRQDRDRLWSEMLPLPHLLEERGRHPSTQRHNPPWPSTTDTAASGQQKKKSRSPPCPWMHAT